MFVCFLYVYHGYLHFRQCEYYVKKIILICFFKLKANLCIPVFYLVAKYENTEPLDVLLEKVE